MNNTRYSERYNERITRALEWNGIAFQGESTERHELSDVLAPSHALIPGLAAIDGDLRNDAASHRSGSGRSGHERDTRQPSTPLFLSVRVPESNDSEHINAIAALAADKRDASLRDIGEVLGVSKDTVARALTVSDETEGSEATAPGDGCDSETVSDETPADAARDQVTGETHLRKPDTCDVAGER